MSKISFPSDFTWGAATAAYQIEGGAFSDGKGLSVWDMLCRRQGRIWNNQTGNDACDHYNRFAEDVTLMKEIGLQAYRFSFSWPRLLPTGTGAVNNSGLAFYDKLLDSLLEAGIKPWATLFHWDYPLDLYQRGGWLNAESPRWFEDYTKLIVDRFSDRISHWITLNEPQCFIGLGLRDGIHAPSDKLGLPEILRAAHHALLAHGRATAVIRSRAKLTPTVGWAPVGVCFIPATENEADIEAARQATFDAVEDPIWGNAWWGDPPLLGYYPEKALRKYHREMPRITASEMAEIRQPLDFYGVNIYSGQLIRCGENGLPEKLSQPVGHAHSHFVWDVEPRSLYWGPRFLAERYKKPIVITENGMSNVDWVSLDGRVHDSQRIDFLARYLAELRNAISDGVDVRAYFQWSLLDNFEWAEGYKHRFGLIHVDYQTFKRTLKDSAYWYRDIIRTNGSDLPLSGRF